MSNKNCQTTSRNIFMMENNSCSMATLLIYVACCVAPLLDVSISIAISTMFVSLLEEYGESRAATATVQSILLGTTACSCVVAGILLKKIGVVGVSLAGSILLAGGFIFSFFATSIVLLDVLVGLLAGIGVSFLSMSSIVVVRNLFTGPTLEKALSAHNTFISVGSFLYPFLINHLTREYGVKGTFLVVGGLLLNNIVMTLMFYVSEKRRVNTHIRRSMTDKGQQKQTVPGERTSSKTNSTVSTRVDSSCVTYVKALMNVEYILLVVSSSLLVSPINGYLVVFEDVFTRKGYSEGDIANLFTVYYISFMVGSALPIFISFVKRGTDMRVLLIFFTLGGCLGQLLVLFLDNMIGAVAGNILVGLAQGGVTATGTIVVAHITKEEVFSVALGLLLTIYGLLTLGIGPLYGYIWDSLLSYDLTFILTAIFNGVATVSAISSMVYVRWRTRKRSLRIATTAQQSTDDNQSTTNSTF